MNFSIFDNYTYSCGNQALYWYNFFKEPRNTAWIRNNVNSAWSDTKQGVNSVANFARRNVESVKNDVKNFFSRLFGGSKSSSGGTVEPAPFPQDSSSSWTGSGGGALTGGGQFYGGDGSGSISDIFSRFVYETDQFNPIALAWDGIKGNINGTDRYGNELSGFQANLKIVSAIPVAKVASVITGAGVKSLSSMALRGAAKGGMTELNLVTKAAQKAEAAIGGSGGVAGTLKHTYAKNLLSRYQSIYGDRGLNLGSNYFNGPAGKGFLDVVNHNTRMIYDFKFGKAFMSNAQYLKYSNSFPGYGIQVIRP